MERSVVRFPRTRPRPARGLAPEDSEATRSRRIFQDTTKRRPAITAIKSAVCTPPNHLHILMHSTSHRHPDISPALTSEVHLFLFHDHAFHNRGDGEDRRCGSVAT
jgi:hypothetical protein